MVCCTTTQALGVSFDDVIYTNVRKLEKRYPGGSFDVYYSENRQEEIVKDLKIPFTIVSFLLVQVEFCLVVLTIDGQ